MLRFHPVGRKCQCRNSSREPSHPYRSSSVLCCSGRLGGGPEGPQGNFFRYARIIHPYSGHQVYTNFAKVASKTLANAPFEGAIKTRGRGQIIFIINKKHLVGAESTVAGRRNFE